MQGKKGAQQVADNAVPKTKQFNEEQLKPGAEKAGEGLKTGADKASQGLQNAADQVSQQAGALHAILRKQLLLLMYAMAVSYGCTLML